MESKGLLLVFSTLIFMTEAFAPYVIPQHYDYLEKFACVRTADVFLDRGALIAYTDAFLQTWPGNSEFNCKTTVFSKTKNTGIIGVIQALKFRKVPNGCRDYVTLEKDNTKICGDIVVGLKKTGSGKLPPPPVFISEFSGLFAKNVGLYIEYSTDIHGRGQHVDSRKRIVCPGAVVEESYTLTTALHVNSRAELEFDEELQFSLAFTGYQDCEDTRLNDQMFNCGYGVCILKIFVNDGVVNCPFGDCRDEGGCENAILTSHFLTEQKNLTKDVQKVEDKNMVYRAQPAPMALHIASNPVVTSLMGSQAIDEMKNIGEELKKHNGILGHISSLIERGVVAMEEKKNIQSEE